MSQAEGARADSIDDQDRARADGDKKPKSRRPANTAFRQQRLKAWQPILTPKSVLPLFFAIGIIFAPLGGVLLWASSLPPTSNPATIPSGVSYTFKATPRSKPTWQQYHNSTTDATTCILTFDIPESMGPPVYLYYRLTNFYQNHRRYVQSLDVDQLKGTAVPSKTIKGGTCEPLTTDPVTKKPYYPCGLIANSKFNDSIGSPLFMSTDGAPTYYNMTDKGIAWESDKALFKKSKYKPSDVMPPPNWVKTYGNGTYTDENFPNLNEMEDLMVWMRTAGLPAFSKLARRNDDTAMAPGIYKLNITDHFPVTEYHGTKSILISTRTVLGGKNPFMGIAYVVVGGICVLLGALFTIAHLVRPRKLGDHTYLTWDSSNQPTTAMATGRASAP
ncbi:hypothetical protein N7470_000695 [Penicillium chermesinum]|nr:hypothetical protein N7470_000695 [Penicillium chermesinum]